ncbi:hypothetical protein BBK14_11160 [Parafrankia soli]|uniref:N-acetylmuramoyl-L-alanine amidase domain-containing protein n=1 Tax=Parafrankia soli TaxID=2599596 RepID=A0A1S1R5F7_9ACTN|nr:peptidoglycan recognition family protein [Parafrankia soli]OHV42173.1 hypothetical protein BBK14_11160 [Parafrankia soli]
MTYPTRYPGAVWRPLDRHFTAGGIVVPTRGLIPHVAEGNGSLFGWFSNSASQVSAHLWVSKAGVVEQYVSLTDRAWAQAAGNRFWVSVECEGYVAEDYTPAQVQRLAEIYRWGMDVFAWPAQITDDPNGYGLGTHRMGGSAWGGHSCPGDLRAGRRRDILAAALGQPATPPPSELEDDMDEPTLRKVLNEGTAQGQESWAGTSRETLRATQATFNQAKTAADGIGALGRQLQQILAQQPVGEPLTVDRMLAAIDAATDPVALVAFVEASGARLRQLYAGRTS